jgi:Ulp1 protease family, C-terminal catalytic domain
MLLLVLFFIFLTLVQAFRKPPEDINCFRIIYPSYFEKHFTVVVLDTPGDSKRVPRAVFLDPLQEFREEVTNAFVSYFKQTKCDNFSISHVHGGDQGNNMTECGIFAMMNCQILLTEQTFFPLQEWKAKSLQRKCDAAIAARVEYAALLREHVIQYICAGSAVALPQCQMQSVNVSADQQLPPFRQQVRLFTCHTDAEKKDMLQRMALNREQAQRNFAKFSGSNAPVAPAATRADSQLLKRKADVVAAAAAAAAAADRCM